MYMVAFALRVMFNHLSKTVLLPSSVFEVTPPLSLIPSKFHSTF